MNEWGLKRARAAGYLQPGERPACSNCNHGEVRVASDQCLYPSRKRIWCAIFKTDLNLRGICPQHSSGVSK